MKRSARRATKRMRNVSRMPVVASWVGNVVERRKKRLFEPDRLGLVTRQAQAQPCRRVVEAAREDGVPAEHDVNELRGGMLDQRKERIAMSMKDAERVSASAQEAELEKAQLIEAARREAQEIRAQASRDAERIAQEVRTRADEDATEIRMKAHEDAQRQVAAALAYANKDIAELAILATEQVLGRELADRTEQERFVEEFLTNFSEGSAS